jgi:glycosyltransferase involved in cell wall biosynthesis
MRRVLIATPNDMQHASPQTLYLAESLQKAGVKVCLIGPIHQSISIPGVDICRVPPGRLRNILTILRAFIKASLRHYDLLIGFDEVGLIPCLAGSWFRPSSKVVLYNLEYFEDQPSNKCRMVARKLYRSLAGRASFVMDANEDRSLLRAGLCSGANVGVIHNAAPLNDPDQRPPEDPIYRNVPKDRVRLLYTGCKNHTVIEVIRALECVTSPIHFFVVGEIDPNYIKAIEDSHGDQRVTLAGLVPRERLSAILAWADIGISLYGNAPEAFIAQRMCAPNKVYEYMAWGLPSICSDNPPLVHLVRENGWGICVPPTDKLKIAEAIETLAGNPKLRTSMSQNAVALHKKSMNYEEQIRPILRLALHG